MEVLLLGSEFTSDQDILSVLKELNPETIIITRGNVAFDQRVARYAYDLNLQVHSYELDFGKSGASVARDLKILNGKKNLQIIVFPEVTNSFILKLAQDRQSNIVYLR